MVLPKEIKVGDVLDIGGTKFEVVQRIKWKMLLSNSSYIKFVLKSPKGDFRLAYDDEAEKWIFGKVVETGIKMPFGKEVIWKGKRFKFYAKEVCIAEEVQGSGKFRVGSMEAWWDFTAEDGSYISLGYDIETLEREDIVGRWVEVNEVEVAKKV